MKQVIVFPRRCVGCMQCMVACSVAHSRSGFLYAALGETPVPRPRIHVGAGLYNEGFPNRCRHCDPAPCMAACLPGAIYRETKTASVLINPDVCINCASCAMACPYGVIRYHSDPLVKSGKTIAVKCDNCISRQFKGKIPACVEACKAGALSFEEMDDAMERETDRIARAMTPGEKDGEIARHPGYALHMAVKKAAMDMNRL